MSDSASERPTVAVVDDDPRIRALLDDELTDEGFEPSLCASGAELLELVDRRPIGLILLDLMMPGMDGLRPRPFARRNSRARLPWSESEQG